MRKNVEAQDLLAAISNAGEPLSVDQIAQSVGSMRHLITSQLKKMAKDGVIAEVKTSDAQPLRFQAGLGKSLKSEDVSKPAREKTRSGNVLHAFPSAAARSNERPAVSGSPAVDESIHASIASISHQNHQVAGTEPVIKPDFEAKSSEARNDTKLTESQVSIVSLLHERARQQSELPEILTSEAAIQDLDFLISEGYVDKTRILDDYVYELTDKAESELADELSGASKIDTVHELVQNETGIEEKTQETNEGVNPLQQDQPSLGLQPTHVSGVGEPDVSLITKMVGELVEKLVEKRNGELQDLLKKQERDQALFENFGRNLKLATDSLQVTLDALQSIAKAIDARTR